MATTVEFFDISKTRSVLTEAEELMTPKQQYQLFRQIKRLEEHGWVLNGAYFGRVKGVKEKLNEFRLTLDRVEFRFLFTDEQGTFVMLAVYKEKRDDVPDGAIDSAEARIAQWRKK